MKVLSSLLLVLSFSLVGCAHHGAKASGAKKDCKKSGICDLKKKDCKSGKCKIKKAKSPCCA